MAKLRIATQDGQVLAVDLQPGVNTLGREAANSLRIEHPTISGFHCEVTVREDAVLVKDLNSTNGTFIDGKQVQEGYLISGQVLQLGAVAMRYEAGLALTPEAPATPAARSAGRSGTGCRNHPEVPAELVCIQCHQLFCTACVTTRPASGKVWQLCPVCKGRCRPLREHLEEEQRRRTLEGQTFFQRLPGVFKYPFVRGGAVLLVAGTLLYCMMGLAAFVSRYAGGLGLGSALILFVFSVGYLFAFMQRIIVASSQGEEGLPSWPEFTEWGSDIIRPFLMLVFTVAMCFGLPLAYLIYTLSSEQDLAVLVFYPLLAFGFFYFPMALLAVAISDNFSSLNPFVVLPAIAKMPREYLVACLMFFAVVAIRHVGERVLEAIIRIPVLPQLLIGFLALYCLTVEMRILGLLYYTNRKRFGWYE
jgi:hypothetical protein